MMLIIMLGVATGFAQVTTIVNYDFNSGTTYNTLTPVLAPGLACVVDGVATYSLATNGAVATGTNAFTPNTTAGNGLVMTNSSGTNTRYFEFQLSGSGLSQFYAYKIYFQSQRGGAGASKITAAYSTDGVNYTNFPTTQAPGLGAPAECLYDLSSITSINLVPALYIRLLVSGATGTGSMGIDNFQMSATKCTTPANISAGANKVLTCANPSAVLTGSSTTSGVTYSWSPGGATTQSLAVTSAGTYTLKVTDPVNACSSSATYTVQKELCVSANITNYQSEDVKGQASLIIDGGHAPYHIAWNNIKVPTGFVAYHQLIDSLPGLTIDSVQFMHDVDSIRQKTIFPDLSPGIYPVTVYDQSGDSVVLVLSVSNGANDWYHTSGVTSAISAPPYRTVGDRKYYYGTGSSVTQSGTFTSGSCFAIPLAPMNFDGANELSFIVPSVTQIASVGLCERRDTLNGNTADLAANTMFRFNGNSTYDILFNNAVIFNGVLSANDQFMMRTNPTTGKLSYYKNEQFLADTDLLVIDKARGFIPKIVLGSVNASIRGILIKNPLTPKINLQISDLTCSTGNCGGSAYASAYYPIVNSPIRYELYVAGNPSPVQTISAVGVPGVTFTGLCQGNYNVVFHTNMVYFVFVPGGGIVQMTTPVSLQQSFSLNYSPAWTSQPNVSINPTDYSLTKSGGISGAWDAGTSSLNVLKQTASGWIEWTAQSSDAVNGIGFSTTYTGPGITSIDYGVGVAWVSLYGLKVYVMTHNNTMLNSLSNPWGVFTGNETFRLEKDYPNSKINLKINNVLKGSFTVPVFTDYIVNAALQVSGGTIIRPKFSFGCCTDCSSPQQYAELRNKLDGSYYDLRSNKLLFKLNGDYVANTIRFSVQDKFNNTVATHLSSGVINTATLNSGDNRYQLDFSSASYPPGYYVLKVTNEKNEQVFLRFKK